LSVSVAPTVCGIGAHLNRRVPVLKRAITGTSSRKLRRFGKACLRIIYLIDGNKRLAVTVTAPFLRVNGYRLAFTDARAFSFLIDLYESRRMRFAELDTWLRQHAVAEQPTFTRRV